MKKIIWLALFVIAFGCTKDEKEDEECYTCSTTTNGGKLVENLKVCDPVEAARLDGKRIVKTTYDANNVATVIILETKCK